jgi:hypothetical protein
MSLMFGFGKKQREQREQREQEEAEAKRVAALAAADKRKREMEALAAKPEIAAIAANDRAVFVAQGAEHLRREKEAAKQTQEREARIAAWIENNKAEAESIADAVVMKMFEETDLPQDSFKIFKFYCLTPFLRSGRLPGVVYQDGDGAGTLCELYRERLEASGNIFFRWQISGIQRASEPRKHEWDRINFAFIKTRIKREIDAQIIERLSKV